MAIVDGADGSVAIVDGADGSVALVDGADGSVYQFSILSVPNPRNTCHHTRHKCGVKQVKCNILLTHRS